MGYCPKYALLLIAAAASQVYAQSCYYTAGRLASTNYVPCGSIANGQQQACCRLGDNCLLGGVCFNTPTRMTYIAGCTDSSYQDRTCGAQTCSKSSQIQGIAQPCTQGRWQCCQGAGQKGDNPASTSSSSCECDNSAPVAIVGPSVFSLSAILPAASNGQILLVNPSNGQTTGSIAVPTATRSSSSSSSSSVSTPASTTTTSSVISSNTAASASSASSSTGASQTSQSSSASNSATALPISPDNPQSSGPDLKLILGVTIPVIIVLLALAGFGFWLLRKRRRSAGDDFSDRGWDPFRHQPVDHNNNRGGSRSSAVWDNSYNPPAAMAAAPASYIPPAREGTHEVAGDDVAEAVRRNAEAHRRQHGRADSGGLRPVSEMGGFVPWKAQN